MRWLAQHYKPRRNRGRKGWSTRVIRLHGRREGPDSRNRLISCLCLSAVNGTLLAAGRLLAIETLRRRLRRWYTTQREHLVKADAPCGWLAALRTGIRHWPTECHVKSNVSRSFPLPDMVIEMPSGSQRATDESVQFISRDIRPWMDKTIRNEQGIQHHTVPSMRMARKNRRNPMS
jgi:hypothetical protein